MLISESSSSSSRRLFSLSLSFCSALLSPFCRALHFFLFSADGIVLRLPRLRLLLLQPAALPLPRHHRLLLLLLPLLRMSLAGSRVAFLASSISSRPRLLLVQRGAEKKHGEEEEREVSGSTSVTASPRLTREAIPCF